MNLITVLYRLFPKTIEIIKSHAENVGAHREVERRFKESRDSEIFEIEQLIGKLVIMIPNEPENVQVGVVTGIDFITKAKNPVPVIKNLVSGEVSWCLSTVMTYTEQKFDALNAMDANGRIAVMYSRTYEGSLNKGFSEPYIPSDDWSKLVKSVVSDYEFMNQKG